MKLPILLHRQFIWNSVDWCQWISTFNAYLPNCLRQRFQSILSLCHLVLSFFLPFILWMNECICTNISISLYAGISRSYCLLILSIAQSNWFTFCSFARHFQYGCFLRAVCCLSLHNAQCTTCACRCFAYVPIFRVYVRACVRARARVCMCE